MTCGIRSVDSKLALAIHSVHSEIANAIGAQPVAANGEYLRIHIPAIANACEWQWSSMKCLRVRMPATAANDNRYPSIINAWKARG